jgi:hypothetical protein
VVGATGSTQSILTWVLQVTFNVLSSQSHPLAARVAATIRTERPNFTRIGRELAGSITAKSDIKGAWRFTCNVRI